jgi:hypothetical protein
MTTGAPNGLFKEAGKNFQALSTNLSGLSRPLAWLISGHACKLKSQD